MLQYRWSRETELLLWDLSREIATIVLVLIKLQFISPRGEGEGGGGKVKRTVHDKNEQEKTLWREKSVENSLKTALEKVGFPLKIPKTKEGQQRGSMPGHKCL